MTSHTCTVGIIGASFAGLSAYISLKKRYPQASVQLFDQRPAFTFIPSLHETLGKPRRLKHIQFSLADTYGADFHQTKITHVSKDAVITTEQGDTRACEYIVIATWSQTNFHNLSPYKEFAYTVRYPDDIAPLNEALSHATSTSIIGWGYTGIEVISILADRKIWGKLRLIHNQERFFPQYATSVWHTADRWLRKHNVELVMNAQVAEIAKDHIVLQDGTKLPSDVTIVNTGIIINDQQHSPQLTFSAESNYHALQNDRIYTCGDVAIHGLFTTAHNAYNEGKRIGNIIADRLQNTPRTYPPLENYRKLAVALGDGDGIMVINEYGVYVPRCTGFFKRLVEKKILFEFKNKVLLPF